MHSVHMRSVEKKISAAILRWIRARRQPASGNLESAIPETKTMVPAKLRVASFADFSAVAELKQRGGLNADSLENWERLWRQNPAIAEHPVERPIGWVLEADGKIVGYMGNISLLYRLGGKTLTAVTAHGLVVDPAYRSMSVTLVSAFFRQKSVDLFVSTSAIEAVGKMALAFKSSPLPQADYDTALFWVLKPYSFARVLMRKLEVSQSLATVGSALVGLAVAADTLLNRRRPKRSPNSLAVTEIACDEIGDDFQVLWEEKQKEERQRNDKRLLADRSSATLRWHFQIPGDRGSARVLCCREKGALVGYAVVRSDTNPQSGLRSSIIADLIVKNDRPEVIDVLWAAAYGHAQHCGSDLLEVLGFPPEIRSVGAQWKPYRRKYPACPFYYKAADPELQKTLAAGAAWYASPFDGDATLIRPSYSEQPRREASFPQFENAENPLHSHTLVSETTEVY